MPIFDSFSQIPKDFFPDYLSVDIKGQTQTGGRIVRDKDNRVFLWNFSKEHLDDMILIFNKLRNSPLNSGIRHFLRRELTSKGLSMLREGVFPVECILYASKTVNNILINDKEVVEEIARALLTISEENKEYTYITFEHIIKNWDWVPQLKIAIITVGLLKNDDLIEHIYKYHSTDDNFKLESVKAFVYSQNMDSINYIIEIISTLDELNTIDREIANFLAENFEKYYTIEGIRNLYAIYRNFSLSSYPRKIIEKICSSYMREISSNGNLDSNRKTMEYFIKLANTIANKNRLGQDVSDLVDEMVDALYDKRYRSLVLTAAAFTNMHKMAEYVFECLKKEKLNSYEFKEALLTLGFLKYSEARDYVENLKLNKTDRISMLAYQILLGERIPATELADMLLLEDDLGLLEIISKIINRIVKRVPYLREELKRKFYEYINSNELTERLKVYRNVKTILSNIADRELVRFLCRQLGYREELKATSEDEQALILRLINECLSLGDRKIVEELLFNITSNGLYSQRIRREALKMINQIGGIRPPNA